MVDVDVGYKAELGISLRCWVLYEVWPSVCGGDSCLYRCFSTLSLLFWFTLFSFPQSMMWFTRRWLSFPVVLCSDVCARMYIHSFVILLLILVDFSKLLVQCVESVSV